MSRNRSKCKQFLEYWINNFPELSKDECENLRKQYVKENNYQCIEYYKKRFPDKSLEELEVLRVKAVNKSQSKQIKFGDKNPNSKKNASVQKRKENSPYSIEYYKKRFPDKSLEELEVLRKKFVSGRKYIKENHSNTLEYYTSRGHTKEEAKVLLANRQRTFSLDKCIEKYGEENGKKIFESRQAKWLKSLQHNFMTLGESRSSKSQGEIELIKMICDKLGIDVPTKQKYICGEDHNYAYDFEYNHKIIEYNGDYWHCNPQIYSSDYIHKTTKLTAAEIWKKDADKINTAKKYGYDVLVVWESEYLLNKNYVIEKCINFLKD